MQGVSPFDTLTPRTRSLLTEVFGRLTRDQRNRVARLATEWRDLKAELLALRVRETPIEEVEPVLAPPRSSLNPQHFDASHDLG